MRAMICLVLAGTMFAAAPSAADPLPSPHSWGKLGVTFDQYRKDAFECTYTSYLDLQAQVSKKPRITDTPMLEYNADGSVNYDSSLQTFIEQYQLQQVTRTKETNVALQAAIDACLRGRSYRPFLLTDAQWKTLKTLPAGSAPRHHYLYSLATDPSVLSGQAL